MPDLLEIESIASSTPPRTVTLSGISVTVLFSALNAAGRISDWWAGDAPLDSTQIDQLEAWLAAAYKELMVSQIGEIKMFATAAAPSGCLICDGSTYDRADYPDLYTVLPSAFIIDGSTFFVPDLRSRFVMGAADSLLIGNMGGEAAHTLSVGEIPSHSHTIPLTATTLAVEPGEVTVLTPVPILTSSTGDTGGGGSHNNIPPYMEIAFYIVAV